MTKENISQSISTKECCRPRRGRTHDLLVSSRTAHPNEPPRPASESYEFHYDKTCLKDNINYKAADKPGLHNLVRVSRVCHFKLKIKILFGRIVHVDATRMHLCSICFGYDHFTFAFELVSS